MYFLNNFCKLIDIVADSVGIDSEKIFFCKDEQSTAARYIIIVILQKEITINRIAQLLGVSRQGIDYLIYLYQPSFETKKLLDEIVKKLASN